MHNAIMVGERIYLRPVEVTDADILAAITATETENFMYRGRMPYSPLAFANGIREGYKRSPPPSIAFAVCLRGDDRCIGMVGIDSIDYVNRTGETFTDLGPAAIRNQGYGTEAKHLLLEYAFDRLQLHSLRSVVMEPNTRSVAALMKQGYRPAGRLQSADVKNRRYHDALFFDVLRDEWLAARDAWRRQRAAGGGERR
jgi:RimJ/RimL family protein N-acetyltransferase